MFSIPAKIGILPFIMADRVMVCELQYVEGVWLYIWFTIRSVMHNG